MVTRDGSARSAELSHSPSYCPSRRDDLSLGGVGKQVSVIGGAATVRTSLRLPKPKAPRALDITSVIREELGQIATTLARKQIKRAFVTSDGIYDNVSNVKSNGYPQRVTVEKTLQQITDYYEHVILQRVILHLLDYVRCRRQSFRIRSIGVI